MAVDKILWLKPARALVINPVLHCQVVTSYSSLTLRMG